MHYFVENRSSLQGNKADIISSSFLHVERNDKYKILNYRNYKKEMILQTYLNLLRCKISLNRGHVAATDKCSKDYYN